MNLEMFICVHDILCYKLKNNSLIITVLRELLHYN